MANNVPSTASAQSTESATPAPVFKGYSLDDLRYQRTVVDLKKTFLKEKLLGNVTKIKQATPFLNGGKNGSMPKLSGIAGKVLNGMNYIDYAMIGYSLFSTGKKIFSFFRRKKNK